MTTLRDREPQPRTEASEVVIEQMASLVAQVRAIAFPEMVGQPIPQDDLRAALALIEEQAATEARRELLAKVEEMADDVRFGGGTGTSDYWRGFNDGIDKLVAHLIEEQP